VGLKPCDGTQKQSMRTKALISQGREQQAALVMTPTALLVA